MKKGNVLVFYLIVYFSFYIEKAYSLDYGSINSIKKGNSFKVSFLEEANTPKFLFGKEFSSFFKIVNSKNQNIYLKIRLRLQGVYENYEVLDKNTGIKNIDVWAGYFRRERIEAKLGLCKGVYFAMDIRNDRSSYKNKGLQQIKLGNAYLSIEKPFGNSLINFRIFKAKIDISRTETVKSVWILHHDRPLIADFSAQFISYNRNSANFQVFGNWKHKIHYQFAVGKGIYSGKFKDVKGNYIKKVGGAIKKQDLFYGGKIIISPFSGWEEKNRTETYFGIGKHIEFGIGYWKLPNIRFVDSAGKGSMDRTLLNYEFSLHYKNFFLGWEYFKFDGIEKDFSDTKREIGKSDGWYIKGEYVFPNFHYIAPFGRYEEWNKWSSGESGYKLKSKVIGINWYLKGNSIRLGIAYQENDYGLNIGNKKIKRYKFLSQIYF